MTKKEMIEEMASDMNYGCVKHDLYPDDAKEIAKVLVILGYRKIPEGSVVLTEMQYNMLLNNQSTVISIDERLKKEFEYELNQARKEEAKEFLKAIGDIETGNGLHTYTLVFIYCRLKEIAKQYGVEE